MKNINLPKNRNKEMKTKTTTKPPKALGRLTTLRQSPEELQEANNLLNKAKEQRKPFKVLPKGANTSFTPKK